jgi:hypothetical protein
MKRKNIHWVDLAALIPHTVNIGGRIFEVLWSDSLDEGESLGHTRFHTNQIVMDSSMDAKEKVITWLHELTHVVSEVYELKLSENKVLLLEKLMPFLLMPGNIFKEEEKGKKKRGKSKSPSTKNKQA